MRFFFFFTVASKILEYYSIALSGETYTSMVSQPFLTRQGEHRCIYDDGDEDGRLWGAHNGGVVFLDAARHGAHVCVFLLLLLLWRTRLHPFFSLVYRFRTIYLSRFVNITPCAYPVGK